jgi:hypothetical protein
MYARAGKFALATAAAAMLALPTTAHAQGNGPGTWQFEVGGGAAVPLSSALKDFVKTGADFDVLIGYQVHERVGLNAYGGLSLFTGKDDELGFTTGDKLPSQDIWRFGIGAEINLTNPGNAFMAVLGAGLGAANVKVSAFVSSGDVSVPASSSTNFSTLTALKFLYKMNPNFALGAGAEWVLVFSADTFSSSTQGETLSYLPVKVFMRWMQ